jgi:peptidoglycan/LPS O-acetylase OafA/YrhL
LIRYRADIDGLRALAVLAVVAFHADVPGTGGGFVGVDVFLVISGFLIASLLLDELSVGRLFLLDFYKRRVLRIFPALVPMLAATLALGWAIFPAEDYRNLGASALAAATFVSNLYFLQDAGYFSTAAEANPLLHTWSLSVEEQYYLLFPPYLLAIRRFDARARRWATVALWLASFVLSVVLVEKDPKAAFYILPTRTWELLTGVLLAMGLVREPKSWFEARISVLTGLALIGASIVGYGPSTRIPGLAAIPPVFGAAFVIWAGLSSTPPPLRVLTARASNYIGRISYPLYLWHFPAIGFVRYVSFGTPGPGSLAAAVAGAAALAALSYAFLEKPIRLGGRKLSPRFVLGVGLGGMAAVAGASLAIYLGRGAEFRFTGDRLALSRGFTDRSEAARACMNRSGAEIAKGRLCQFGGGESAPETLIWGDSFAEAELPGFEEAARRRNRSFFFAGRHGCEPRTGRGLDAEGDRKCRAFSAATLEFALERPELRQVVLAFRWPAAKGAASAPAAAFARRLGELIEAVSNAGKSVWVTGPLPIAHFNAPRALFLQSLGFGRDKAIGFTRAEFDEVFGWTEPVLSALNQLPNVRTLQIAERFCDEASCGVVAEGHPLYFDDAHLSTTGARRIADDFEAAFP